MKKIRLQEAMKLKKKLIGDITHLKSKIRQKNSYLKGSNVSEKFKIITLTSQLDTKIDELIALKLVINEANRPIQELIYALSEYKALIDMWNSTSVTEGPVTGRFETAIQEYEVQVDELKRDEFVESLQKKIDGLQSEIDVYNNTTLVEVS